MHKKELWILTNKCGKLEIILKRGAMACEPRFRVYDFFHIYWSKSEIFFYAWVDEGCSASPTIAYEKQT